MRLSLTLLSHWQNISDYGFKEFYFSTHDCVNNIFHTNTKKVESLKDIISDGAIFTMMKHNGFDIHILTDCKVYNEEFNFLMFLTNEFDVKFVDALDDLMQESKKIQGKNVFLCNIICSPLVEFKALKSIKTESKEFVLNTLLTQRNYYQQSLQVLSRVISSFTDSSYCIMSYSSKDFVNFEYKDSYKAFVLLPSNYLTQAYVTNTTQITFLIAQKLELEMETSELYEGTFNCAVTCDMSKNAIIFNLLHDNIRYNIESSSNDIDDDIHHWTENFSVFKYGSHEDLTKNLEWLHSFTSLHLLQVISATHKQYVRNHSSLNSILYGKQLHSMKTEIIETNSLLQLTQHSQSTQSTTIQEGISLESKDESSELELEAQLLEANGESSANQKTKQQKESSSVKEISSQTEFRAKESSPVKEIVSPVKEILSPVNEILSPVKEVLSQTELTEKTISQKESSQEAKESSEYILSNGTTKIDNMKTMNNDVQPNYEVPHTIITPRSPSDSTISHSYTWKDTLRNKIQLKYGSDKLEGLDKLLSTLEDGIPYTIIVGSDGVSQALYGALPPNLLQVLTNASPNVNLPTNNGSTMRLYGENDSLRIGRMRIDTTSMFLVDQIMVYTGKGKETSTLTRKRNVTNAKCCVLCGP